MRVLSVGMTHGQPGGYGATASRAGEAPEVFSAPGWMAARRKELGDGFSRLLLSGWEAQMAMASQHFRVVSRRGGQAIAETFADLARGRARPEEAYLLSF
jgi:hypothetical protein